MWMWIEVKHVQIKNQEGLARKEWHKSRHSYDQTSSTQEKNECTFSARVTLL